MYFTQTAIRDNQVLTMSEYISTRLVRKGKITSYYVAKCLTNVYEPTVVGTICFIKQTIVKDSYDNQANLQKYRRVYDNEVRVHQFVMKEINTPGKFFSTLLDHWHDVEGVYQKFTIVTKYEEYGDLNHFLEYIKEQKIQLSDSEVIYFVNRLLKATLELYKVGIIHRDIKPENVFIDQFFQIKLGDFGISLLDEKDKNPNSTDRVGTWGFMAPQMFGGQNSPPYSYSVDVWAIGVIMYYMMYLVYPYGRDKKDYDTKIHGRLKDIENASIYNDHFSKRLKQFMKRFFLKPAQQREKAIVLYEYEYMHDYRSIEIILGLKKKYEKHITELNSCNQQVIQRFALQQHSLYTQRIIQVVHYKNWGYFFFLSNLKVIALFNSKPKERVIRVYPDCLQDVRNYRQDTHCVIISEVFKLHFEYIKKDIEENAKVYTKRLNCTIDNIVQCKDTLMVRLKLQLSSKRELKDKDSRTIPPQFEQIKPNSKNKYPLSYQNHTQQFFFFPKQFPQDKLDNKLYTTYLSSLTLHNSLIKRKQVIITDINHKLQKFDQRYDIKKYDNAQDIAYLGDNTKHKNMYNHTKKLLTFAANKQKQKLLTFAANNQTQQNPHSFLSQYKVNDC